MPKKLVTYQGGTLRDLFTERQNSIRESISIEGSLYHPVNLWHVYLKLDFEKKYENAENQKDATSFLKNVGKAAQLAEAVVSTLDGVLIEAQGPMIHLLLPTSLDEDGVKDTCKALDLSLDKVFSGQTKVKGWRMTADYGKTVLVEHDGIHGDSSFVSLGKAANRPAKFLYQQKPGISNEENRRLKRRHLGIYDHDTGRWRCIDLQNLRERFQTVVKAANFSAVDFDITVRSIESSIKGVAEVHAQAAPIDEQSSPTNESPNAYFGWVMRADLDGFTEKVEECRDNDIALMELAQKFHDLMDRAADFAKRHNEMLIQLPWAGDNFTAVSVYDSSKKYEASAQDTLINLSLDFDDEMHEDTMKAGFSGWAQGVAGGNVHGNANGNIFLGAVTIPGRRFLLGAGVGVGRSLQAFVDMNPLPQQFAILYDDCQNMLKPYQAHLKDDSKADKTSSDLFRKGWKQNLEEARESVEKSIKPTLTPDTTVLGVGTSKAVVTSRPYACE